MADKTSNASGAYNTRNNYGEERKFRHHSQNRNSLASTARKNSTVYFTPGKGSPRGQNLPKLANVNED